MLLSWRLNKIEKPTCVCNFNFTLMRTVELCCFQVLCNILCYCNHTITWQSKHMVGGRVVTCIIYHWSWMQHLSNNLLKVIVHLCVHIPCIGNMSITYYSPTTTAMPFVFTWCYEWCSLFKLCRGCPGERCHAGKRRNCPVVWAQTPVNMHVGDPHQPKTKHNKNKASEIIGMLHICLI